ncbi:MAG: response regulator transcription factor [Roseivirga sp.]|nr:response regulator transcription factor [Roseivirga sp.]
MNFSAIVVDDEEYARDIVKSLLAQDASIDLLAECSNGAEAIEQIKALKPDMVFLDIQMPEVNGFEVIEATRNTYNPHYIFTTAYDAFALRAFEVNALDYLLKPFDDDRFFDALQKAKNKAEDPISEAMKKSLLALIDSSKKTAQAYIKRISVRTGGRIHFINVEDIDWIEADNQYVKIHTGPKSQVHRQSLSELESLLDPALFIRIHRSTIVNIDRIASLEPHFRGDFVISLKDSTRLKLAKSRKEALRELMGW